MGIPQIKELALLAAYGLIPLPGLLYLGAAVYLRERRHSEGWTRFAVFNGILVSVVLGAFIGVLPALLYAIQFISYLSSTLGEPSRNETLLYGLLIGCPIAMVALTGLLSFRYRRFFKQSRIGYYLPVTMICVPLLSAAYLVVDWAKFELSH
jgi:Gpi18-like mannosyltransferase